MSGHAGVSTMLALEVLGKRAADAGDLAMLGVVSEAWERGGWCIQYLGVAGDDVIWKSRYRRNRARLRHQADALLAAIPLLPLTEREWLHLKWTAERFPDTQPPAGLRNVGTRLWTREGAT